MTLPPAIGDPAADGPSKDRAAPAASPGVEPAPAAPPQAGTLNVANAITVVRLLLVPVFAVLLLNHHGEDGLWRAWAFTAFAVASVTDRLDGEVARRRGLVTDFGKIADPIADKALTGTALVSLSVLGDPAWWITVVILVREFGVTLLRLWVIRHGVIAASRGGKAKTLLQTVAIGMYVLPFSGVWGHTRWWLMMAALVLTVVTGVDYVLRALRLRRPGGRAADRRLGAGGRSAAHADGLEAPLLGADARPSTARRG